MMLLSKGVAYCLTLHTHTDLTLSWLDECMVWRRCTSVRQQGRQRPPTQPRGGDQGSQQGPWAGLLLLLPLLACFGSFLARPYLTPFHSGEREARKAGNGCQTGHLEAKWYVDCSSVLWCVLAWMVFSIEQQHVYQTDEGNCCMIFGSLLSHTQFWFAWLFCCCAHMQPYTAGFAKGTGAI